METQFEARYSITAYDRGWGWELTTQSLRLLRPPTESHRRHQRTQWLRMVSSPIFKVRRDQLELWDDRVEWTGIRRRRQTSLHQITSALHQHIQIHWSLRNPERSGRQFRTAKWSAIAMTSRFRLDGNDEPIRTVDAITSITTPSRLTGKNRALCRLAGRFDATREVVFTTSITTLAPPPGNDRTVNAWCTSSTGKDSALMWWRKATNGSYILNMRSPATPPQLHPHQTTTPMDSAHCLMVGRSAFSLTTAYTSLITKIERRNGKILERKDKKWAWWVRVHCRLAGKYVILWPVSDSSSITTRVERRLKIRDLAHRKAQKVSTVCREPTSEASAGS